MPEISASFEEIVKSWNYLNPHDLHHPKWLVKSIGHDLVRLLSLPILSFVLIKFSFIKLWLGRATSVRLRTRQFPYCKGGVGTRFIQAIPRKDQKLW